MKILNSVGGYNLATSSPVPQFIPQHITFLTCFPGMFTKSKNTYFKKLSLNYTWDTMLVHRAFLPVRSMH